MQAMCSVMKVHPSGFYAWKQTPDSARAVENRRLLGQIKQCWIQSGAVYANCDEPRQSIFDYIEMFYNPVRRHSHNDGLSPVKYEMHFNQRLASV